MVKQTKQEQAKKTLIIVSVIALSTVSCVSTGDRQVSEDPKPAVVLHSSEATPINFPLHPTSRLAHASSNVAGMSFFEMTLPVLAT